MKKLFSLLLVIALAAVSLTGCGSSQNGIYGKWAYNHDENTAIISLESNGKAVYNDTKYSFTYDNTFITLTAADGSEIKMRYEMEKDGMLLYQNTDYVYTSGDDPQGIIGIWTGKDVDKWSFEFTNEGTFKEDGYFPGYYTVDKSKSTIKLVYNDQFTDTICYYSISGNEMTLAYPWKMVKMK